MSGNSEEAYMKKIRVLEMIDRPFLGGGQMVLLSLARNIDRERFEVTISAKGGGPLENAARENGISFYPVPFRRGFSFRLIDEIASILRTKEIDILHTHGGIAGFYGRWAARKARTPVVVHTLHGIHYLHYRNFFLKWSYAFLERLFSRFTDALIYVSEADRRKGKMWKLAAESRSHVIRNGIDFPEPPGRAELDSLRKELGIEPGQAVVGTVARLHRQKGLIYLVRAARVLRLRHPEARIVMVGGGPLKQALVKTAERIVGPGGCLFLGERSDAREILPLFDVFVLPSLWEGLPLALIEAATIAKPIVASDIDGVREVIRNGETGLLVPSADPQGLADAISRLLEERDFAARLGNRARTDIPPRFALKRMVEETENLYIRLFASSPT